MLADVNGEGSVAVRESNLVVSRDATAGANFLDSL